MLDILAARAFNSFEQDAVYLLEMAALHYFTRHYTRKRYPTPRKVDVHVRRLRSKSGPQAARQIETDRRAHRNLLALAQR